MPHVYEDHDLQRRGTPARARTVTKIVYWVIAFAVLAILVVAYAQNEEAKERVPFSTKIQTLGAVRIQRLASSISTIA